MGKRRRHQHARGPVQTKPNQAAIGKCADRHRPNGGFATATSRGKPACRRTGRVQPLIHDAGASSSADNTDTRLDFNLRFTRPFKETTERY